MSILGESATFVGTLTTIVVLCIISDNQSGNFLYSYLLKVVSTTRNIAGNIQKDLLRYSYKYGLRSVERDFYYLVASLSDDRRLEDFLNKKIIEFKIKMDYSTIQYSKEYVIPVNNKIEEIRKCDEQTYSPLFVFAYCLIIFFADEVASISPAIYNLMVFFVIIFTSVSFIFLGTIWVKFSQESKHIPSIINSRDFFSIKNFRERGEYGGDLLALLFLYVFCFNIFAFGNFNKMEAWWAIVFVTIISLLIFLVVGYHHIKLRAAYGKYNYSFIFYHFCIIFLSSFLISLIMWIPVIKETAYEITYVLIPVKLFIFFFIIIFGIIVPFFVPYNALKYIENYAKIKSEEAKAKLQNDNSLWSAWIAAFLITVQSIKEQEENNH